MLAADSVRVPRFAQRILHSFSAVDVPAYAPYDDAIDALEKMRLSRKPPALHRPDAVRLLKPLSPLDKKV